MALADYISDSQESSDPLDLIQTTEKRRQKSREKEPSLPGSALSHRFRGPPEVLHNELASAGVSTSEEKKISVMVQGPSRPWEYQPFDMDQTVDEVLAEIDLPGGEVWYRIEYADGRREDVSTGILHIAPEFCAHVNANAYYEAESAAMKP